MVRKLITVSIIVWVMVGCVTKLSHSGEGYNTLKYEYKYLYNWTAFKMGVELNPNKAIPILAFLSDKELVRVVGEKYNLKNKYATKDGSITIHISYYGVFLPETNTIFINSDEKDPEANIVHELVHFIQYTYLSQQVFNNNLEKEAIRITALFRKEHKK